MPNVNLPLILTSAGSGVQFPACDAGGQCAPPSRVERDFELGTFSGTNGSGRALDRCGITVRLEHRARENVPRATMARGTDRNWNLTSYFLPPSALNCAR